jgi:hypothetical protein
LADTWGGSWGSSWALSWTRGGVTPTPTPAPDTAVKGGIPGRGKKARKRERVYIQVDDRALWFANEDNAIAFLRTQGAITEKRVAAEISKVVAKAVPTLAPFVLPRITVRGSEEAHAYAKELDLRMRQMLAMLDAQYLILLDDDDDMMLLH